MKILDVTNNRFGQLTARWPVGRVSDDRIWLCSCDCGNLTYVRIGKIRSGNTKSCGCLRKAELLKRTYKHGQTGTLEHTMWLSARVRAKKKNIPFNLELSDVVIPSFCPLLEIPIRKSKSALSSNSPTLDRIIPAVGYVKGNVRVISHKANTSKSNLTIKEMELLLKNWRKLLGSK